MCFMSWACVKNVFLCILCVSRVNDVMYVVQINKKIILLIEIMHFS